jgi:GNAT superfamily N-acetyltransferase
MSDAPPGHLRVSYLELRAAPGAPCERAGPEHIALERPGADDYLALYRRVGGPLSWDTRLGLERTELEALLAGARIHVLRGADGAPLGFCEFDPGAHPDLELKHFGLMPEAQGRGLGSWFLATVLHREWEAGARRIWLHTDNWDHPAALHVYERAGFRVYDVRYQPPEGL